MNTPTLRERDLAWLRQTFQRFPWIGEVRVFGSRATGTARRASDIDLAISAPEAVTPGIIAVESAHCGWVLPCREL